MAAGALRLFVFARHGESTANARPGGPGHVASPGRLSNPELSTLRVRLSAPATRTTGDRLIDLAFRRH